MAVAERSPHIEHKHHQNHGVKLGAGLDIKAPHGDLKDHGERKGAHTLPLQNVEFSKHAVHHDGHNHEDDHDKLEDHHEHEAHHDHPLKNHLVTGHKPPHEEDSHDEDDHHGHDHSKHGHGDEDHHAERHVCDGHDHDDDHDEHDHDHEETHIHSAACNHDHEDEGHQHGPDCHHEEEGESLFGWEERFSRIAEAAVSLAAFPRDTRLEKNFLLLSGKGFVGKIVLDKKPTAAIAHNNQELTEQFSNALKSNRKKSPQAAAEKVALVLAKLHDSRINDISSMIPLDNQALTSQQAIAILALDMEIRTRTTQAEVSPEQLQKERTIQELAKKLNDRGIYFINMDTDHSNAYHMELKPKLDAQGRPIIGADGKPVMQADTCPHSEQADKVLKNVSEQMRQTTQQLTNQLKPVDRQQPIKPAVQKEWYYLDTPRLHDKNYLVGQNTPKPSLNQTAKAGASHSTNDSGHEVPRPNSSTTPEKNKSLTGSKPAKHHIEQHSTPVSKFENRSVARVEHTRLRSFVQKVRSEGKPVTAIQGKRTENWPQATAAHYSNDVRRVFAKKVSSGIIASFGLESLQKTNNRSEVTKVTNVHSSEGKSSPQRTLRKSGSHSPDITPKTSKPVRPDNNRTFDQSQSKDSFISKPIEMSNVTITENLKRAFQQKDEEQQETAATLERKEKQTATGNSDQAFGVTTSRQQREDTTQTARMTEVATSKDQGEVIKNRRTTNVSNQEVVTEAAKGTDERNEAAQTTQAAPVQQTTTAPVATRQGVVKVKQTGQTAAASLAASVSADSENLDFSDPHRTGKVFTDAFARALAA